MLTDSLDSPSSLVILLGETPASDEVSEFSPMIGLNCSLMSPTRCGRLDGKRTPLSTSSTLEILMTGVIISVSHHGFSLFLSGVPADKT